MWFSKKKRPVITETKTFTRGPRKGQTITITKRLIKRRTPRKILIDKLDDVIKEIVRSRDQYTCIRCGKIVDGSQAHTSHFFNRGNSSTRWDLSNVDLLCFFCHQTVENRKSKTLSTRSGSLWNYEEYKIQQLGEERFNELFTRSQTTAKFTVSDLEDLYNELRKRL